MSELRFDGRVVVVTGAGAGLGRAYALLFGSRGAKVVVNDLGGSRQGEGRSLNAADAVVDEIRKNGGTAVADYNSVVEGEKIIKTALDNFGRVHVVVNNAGILRDKSFPRISEQDWDLILNVHLKGSFKTTQAAFPIFKKQGYGRIIVTSSTSGLYGNFGQANYSAAKLGLVGLANTIAIEGAKYNIHCNVIVPTAASRLTEDILPPDLFQELKPELIAPVVLYLCHESCTENGTVVLSAAGWAGKIHLVRSKGALLRSNINEGVTLETVAKKWDEIIEMSNAKHYTSGHEETAALVNSLNSLRGDISDDSDEDDQSAGLFTYNNRDVILYALGVGASTANANDLRYIYENDENFGPLPTFFVLAGMQSGFQLDMANVVPGREVSLQNVLHGEQFIEFFRDIPAEGTLRTKSSVVEVLDKGSGAVIVVESETFNERGELLLRNQSAIFIVGAGGFGGPRTGQKIVPCLPKPERTPDLSLVEKTSIDQAALYRLSGDRNPLHIDPNFAVVSGQKQPILHGLCTFGFSVRLLVRAFAADDPRLVKSVKVRFVKPVIPGDSLRVDFWQEGNRVYFKTSVADTKQVVISGAYADLKSVRKMTVDSAPSSSASLQSDAIFEYINEQLQLDPSKGKAVNAVFEYNITKDGQQVKQWTMDLKNGKVYEGAPKEKPNTTLTVSDEDFMDMATNKLQPQVAFMKGKLKITGNIMLAQKLGPLLKANSKL